MRDGDDPQPLKRRLKSLDEFERPRWFPRFRIPEREAHGIPASAIIVVGLLGGGAIGYFLLDW